MYSKCLFRRQKICYHRQHVGRCHMCNICIQIMQQIDSEIWDQTGGLCSDSCRRHSWRSRSRSRGPSKGTPAGRSAVGPLCSVLWTFNLSWRFVFWAVYSNSPLSHLLLPQCVVMKKSKNTSTSLKSIWKIPSPQNTVTVTTHFLKLGHFEWNWRL